MATEEKQEIGTLNLKLQASPAPPHPTFLLPSSS